jgi:hypothetical protein
LIDRNGEEALVSPVPAGSEWKTVRAPLGEEGVDFLEKKIILRIREVAISAKHPRASGVRQILHW